MAAWTGVAPDTVGRGEQELAEMRKRRVHLESVADAVSCNTVLC